MIQEIYIRNLPQLLFTGIDFMVYEALYASQGPKLLG
jgi:hypothetical protein